MQMTRQTLDEPLYAVWTGAGEDAIFCGLVPMQTLRAMLSLRNEAEQRILRETQEGNGWCALHNSRLGKTHYVCYNSKLWQSAGVGPSIEVA